MLQLGLKWGTPRRLAFRQELPQEPVQAPTLQLRARQTSSWLRAYLPQLADAACSIVAQSLVGNAVYAAGGAPCRADVRRLTRTSVWGPAPPESLQPAAVLTGGGLQ